MTSLSLLLCLLIVGMRFAKPGVFDAEDYRELLVAAASTVLRDGPRPDRMLYLSTDGEDPGSEVLEKLRRDLPDLSLRPISERSATGDKCSSSAPDVIIIGACKEDDFLRVDFLAMPLWHVSMLRGMTAACADEIILFKGFRHWHVASFSSVCT